MEALAVGAISLVAPYLVKGAEEFAKQVGKEAFGAVKAVAERLRTWWSNEPVATVAAEQLATDPEKYSTILANLLAAGLADDEEFASELHELVNGVAPHVEVVQRIDIGNGVTGADIEEMLQGSVRVEQQMVEGQNVTGFKAKKLGR